MRTTGDWTALRNRAAVLIGDIRASEMACRNTRGLRSELSNLLVELGHVPFAEYVYWSGGAMSTFTLSDALRRFRRAS